MIEYRYISGIGIIAILFVLCGYATGRAASGHIAPVIADDVDSLMADEAHISGKNAIGASDRSGRSCQACHERRFGIA